MEVDKYIPGPGAYTIPSEFGGKSKGSTIVSRRPDTAIENAGRMPGPGAYSPLLVTKKSAPTVRMGSAPRSSMTREQLYVPGPGNYNPKPIKSTMNIRIGNSLRKPLNDPNTAPGPGAYMQSLSTNDGPRVRI